jgi:ESCRT-II complex subunit VPS22
MRRKGPGVGGIRKAEAATAKLQERGAALQEDRLQHMTEVVGQFRSHLEGFARKYRSQIKSDPVYRAQFQTMCETVGVDPLASSKGLWGELLGLGDYYYELGEGKGA